MKELIYIQRDLKAPKGQYNSFGRYKYRSAESILEAVKPLLSANACTLTVTDEMVLVGNRIYVRATATLKNEAGETEQTTAYAREEDTKKGMDASQVTGAASSYARKYALNGLFCIDDTKDADTDEYHKQQQAAQAAQPAAAHSGQSIQPNKTNATAKPTEPAPRVDLNRAIEQVRAAETEDVLNAIVRSCRPLYTNLQFQEAVKARRAEIAAA